MPSNRFRRHRDGTIRVPLSEDERDVLARLSGEMSGLLAEGLPDEVRHRLFPPAYKDAVADAEFRRLMATDLEERKAADLAALRASLDGPVPLSLNGDQAQAWLGALQDMRLALGTMLGIEEDGWEGDDRDDPQFAILHWLGYLQDSLIQVL